MKDLICFATSIVSVRYNVVARLQENYTTT
ncbi:hypothetical protein GGD38_006296 [Chitinophagaceae bacterium OAS944]|nr:hypothetical protein [Chitinophagaceae bacterium OAS944]